MPLKDKVKNAGQKIYDWATQEDTKALALFDNDSDNPRHPACFLFTKFGIENSQGVTIQSNITDNYTEANFAIQDHWAIAPITFQLSGVVGELVYTPEVRFLEKKATDLTKKISGLTAISPILDTYTRDLERVAKAIDDSVEHYRQIARNALIDIGKYKPNIQQSNIQHIYDLITSTVYNRQLVTIITVFGRISNLAITKVTLNQSDSKYKTDVTIELKQWRDVLTITRPANDREKALYAQNQQAETQDHGTASTKTYDKETTAYYGLFHDQTGLFVPGHYDDFWQR